VPSPQFFGCVVSGAGAGAALCLSARARDASYFADKF
jgi:hypothetical protein